jgi:hypothetical protein
MVVDRKKGFGIGVRDRKVRFVDPVSQVKLGYNASNDAYCNLVAALSLIFDSLTPSYAQDIHDLQDGIEWDKVELDTFLPTLPNGLTFMCIDTESDDHAGSSRALFSYGLAWVHSEDLNRSMPLNPIHGSI